MTETQSINLEQPNHTDRDTAYKEYVEQALKEGLEDIKAGRTHSYDEVMNEFMKDD